MSAPRVTIDQLPEQTVAIGTDLLVVHSGTTTKKMSVSKIFDTSTTSLAAHVNDTVDAHPASAIGAAPNATPMIGTTVQAQLNQAASGVTAISVHVAAVSDAHDASAISVVAIPGLVALDVQAALAELLARVAALET